ncbi:hypothetical protein FB645_001393 [Coemansia sp. IMI 203386]|nr:hypothetical protein FB645_001393 [Coemansia sp. IMI 203386]
MSLTITSSSSYSSVLGTVTKCIHRSISTSVPVSEFPTRIGRPAYTASYNNLDTISTTTTSSTSSCESSSSYASQSDEPEMTRYPFLASEELTLDQQARQTGSVCTTGDCSGTGDWFTKAPNTAAAWATGAVSLALGLWFLVPTFKWQNRGFVRGSLAMLVLSVSVFLRATVEKSEGNTQMRAVQASVAMDYFTGILLGNLCLVIVLKLSSHWTPVAGKTRLSLVTIPYVTACILVGVVIAAVAKMFTDTQNMASGPMNGVSARLLQVALSLVLAQCVVAYLMVFSLMRRDGAKYLLRQLLTVVCCVSLVALWASFMLARTFVVLSNPARSSEVMFYLLSFLPLFLTVALMTVLSSPLAFNFEMTSNWKWNSGV